MPAKPAASLIVDQAVVAQLACPVCHGDLRLEDAGLLCVHCGHQYPVIDGIPVLIPEKS